MRVARAVIRNFKRSQSVESPPFDALRWRRLLQGRGNGPVQLDGILNDLWAKGIPVIPLDVLPAPSFQGLACIVDGYPVIVLGQKYDEPGRVAFLVAHEAGHISAGHCSQDMPVVDEDEAVQDGSAMERDADLFAERLLVGEGDVALSTEGRMDDKELAQKAFDLEMHTGAEASSIIFAWAAKTLDYATAAMAVRALYRSVGARRLLRSKFDEYVDIGSASESDRDLLRCVYGEPQPTATTH